MFPRRILFLAEGQLGDLLILTPALRAMKESFPDSFLSVLVVERRNADEAKPNPFSHLTATEAERETSVLATNSYVDELLVLNRRLLRAQRGLARMKAELAVVTFLRRREFDTVLCTFPEDRFALWAFATGAKVRVGQRQQSFHRLLTNTPAIQKRDGGVLEYYCALARACGAVVHSRRTEYAIPNEAMEWAQTTLREQGAADFRQRIALHPGASGDYKIWPPDRYAALIEYFSRNGKTVVLLGGAMDQPVIQTIKQQLNSTCLEIETGRSVGRLAALIRACSLCITNDSGPQHLAVAVGTPSLAIFRQHHDKEWDVYGENRQSKTVKASGTCPVCPPEVCRDVIPAGERYGSHCLRMVTVPDVIRAAEAMCS